MTAPVPETDVGGGEPGPARGGRWWALPRPQASLTAKGATVLAAGLLIAVAGVLLDRGPLVVLGAAMAAFVVAAQLSRTPLLVHRELSSSVVVEGQEAIVTLTLRNLGRRSVVAFVSDNVSGLLALTDEPPDGVIVLPPSSPVTFRYRVRAPLRGVHGLGPLRLRLRDLHHLVQDIRLVGTTAELEVGIVPLPQDHQPSPLRASDHEGAPHRLPGSGSDFHAIRPYVSGDPYHRINWKATARGRGLLVNQFTQESLPALVAIVDGRNASAAGGARFNFFEVALKEASDLLDRHLRSGQSAGLVVLGSAPVVVEPAAGPAQSLRLAAAVRRATTGGELPLGGLVRTVPLLQRDDLDLVLYSPLPTQDDVRTLVQALSRPRHLQVITAPLALFEGAATPLDGAKVELARWSHRHRVRYLQASGVRTSQWELQGLMGRHGRESPGGGHPLPSTGGTAGGT